MLVFHAIIDTLQNYADTFFCISKFSDPEECLNGKYGLSGVVQLNQHGQPTLRRKFELTAQFFRHMQYM